MKILAPLSVLLLLAGATASTQDKLKKPAIAGTIDRILEGKWKSVGGGAEVCDDGEFLRRLSLDLRGYPPDVAEVQAFLADASEEKRLAKIDEYLASDDYALVFSRWLGDILLTQQPYNYNNLYIQPGKNLNGNTKRRLQRDFMNYLQDEVAKDTGIHFLLKNLLEATGKSEENPVILYKLHMWAGEPPHLEFADRVSKSWLGIQVSCARCHDHPFDRWTQEDFYNLAGFFARHKLKLNGGARDNDCDEVEMYEKEEGEPLKMPETEKVLKARFLYGETAGKNDPYMTALAVFMAGRGHNQLARNFANRMWAWFMGRGIVHPVDDFSQRNRPTVPELLENLAKDFASNKYSLKSMARGICASKAYQRASVRSVTGDAKLHARAAIRQLTADQLLSSLLVATRDIESMRKDRPNAWKWYRGQMDMVFGPGNGWTEISFLPGNARQMLLIRNGEAVQNLLRNGGLVSRLRSMPGTGERVEHAFLSVLCRKPADRERERWTTWLTEHDTQDGYEDFVWTLLNSTEFVTRH